MARVAFFNVPAWGHLNPTLPVVSELIRRGESVVYYNNEEFRAPIEATGAEFRAYHPPVEHDPASAASSVLRLAAAALESSLDLLPRLLEELEKDPVDYVIHDAVCAWGRFVAEALRLPAIASSTTFALKPDIFAPKHRLERLWTIPLTVLRDLRPLRRVLGAKRHLASVYGVTRARVFEVITNEEPLNVVYTSREFQPRPDLFDDTFEFVGASLGPRGEDAEFARELGEGPVIYVSLGTIFNQSLAFYRTCLEALGGLGHRVVMSVGAKSDLSRLGPLPREFVVRPWVPQLLVLSRASLFLTRCGMNSVTESLFYGVPMLLFPEILEQQFVARQVVEASAGVLLSERNLDAGRLRAEARRAIETPAFRQAAGRLGASLREAGGYSRAADVILRYRAGAVAKT